MLFRFCLYGFLKNQRYFEPFLVLVFMEKGLDFFQIGLLIAFRELVVNLLEIPSGAAADILGRRGAMMTSFLAYIAAFIVFGAATQPLFFYPAMLCYAVGDVFRSGTHKAMIFAWLREQGCTSEKTKIYGYTRSWSKLGSAVSVILAAALVFWADGYSDIFYYSIIPYVFGVINFMGYPKSLNGDGGSKSVSHVLSHMRNAVRTTFNHASLRRLVAESMGFEGMFHALKDYLQPILKSSALLIAAGMPLLANISDTRQSALLIGVVYFALYLGAAAASRQSHRVVARFGGEEQAAHRIWLLTALCFVVLAGAGWFAWAWVLSVGFVALHIIQNLWRPILISRFDNQGRDGQGATVLSIESQARRLATMVFAPVLGLAVDWVKASQIGGPFWPLGLMGLVIALYFVVRPTHWK